MTTAASDVQQICPQCERCDPNTSLIRTKITPMQLLEQVLLMMFLHCTAFSCRIISMLIVWVLLIVPEERLNIHHTLTESG